MGIWRRSLAPVQHLHQIDRSKWIRPRLLEAKLIGCSTVPTNPSVGSAIVDRLRFDAIEEARRQWELRWPEAAMSMATTTSIMRAQQIVLSSVDGVLRPFGLTFARYEVLVLLSFTKTGMLPLGKMGQRLMIHPTTVTNVVDRLVQDKLVERVPHSSDRRTTLARITTTGRSLESRATEAVNDIRFGVGGLTDEQMEQMVELVRRLRIVTDDFHS
jgi:DNA-binding MarR family transcriptional regulator